MMERNDVPWKLPKSMFFLLMAIIVSLKLFRCCDMYTHERSLGGRDRAVKFIETVVNSV